MRPHLWLSPQHKHENGKKAHFSKAGRSDTTVRIARGQVFPGEPLPQDVFMYGVTPPSIFQQALGIICYRTVFHGQLDISQTIL